MNLLIILSRVPYPLEKGDKLRAYHQIRCLSVHHRITLVALSHEAVHSDAERILSAFCEEVHVLRLNRFTVVVNLIRALIQGLPLQAGYFYSGRNYRRIKAIIAQSKPDHIYCQLLRTAGYVKDVHIPKTLDYMDVFSAGMLRRKEKAPWLLKPFFGLEYQRLLNYETTVFDWFNHHTIISEPDRALIPHKLNHEIVIISNGVDQDYFTAIKAEKKYQVLFTGNMGYPPNINAAELLVKQVMPLVRKSFPEAVAVLAGANPHARVKALADDNTIVTGWVDDIRPWYAASEVFIAPMQIGTGLQNKLLEAMSMGLPAITSELANGALGAIPGEQILVGTTAEEFAAHIINLLNDKQLSLKIATAGQQYVTDTFSWEGATQKLSDLMTS